MPSEYAATRHTVRHSPLTPVIQSHHLPLPSLLRWDAFSSATSEWEERRRLTAFVVEHKLLGLLPLDAEDEGLDPVGLTLTLADIHAYFESLVQTREIAEACKLLEQSPSSRRDA